MGSDDTPGYANSPAGRTNEATGGASRAEPGPPPPATNQGKDEPSGRPEERAGAGASPMAHRPRLDAPPSAGQSHRTPGHQGESPEPLETDVDAGAARMGSDGRSAGDPVPAPGDADSVPVAGDVALEGSSTGRAAVQGVKTPPSSTDRAAGAPGRPALAPRPGAPDGEVGPV